MVPLAHRMHEVADSITLQVSARAAAMRKAGIDVVSFGAGEPDFDTPDPIKQAGIQAIQKGFTKYTPSTGTVDLRQATEMPVLARIVVPLTAVQKEAIGEVRGMSREFCQVPLPPAARVVQAERTEGAWVVWYVEKVDAI